MPPCHDADGDTYFDIACGGTDCNDSDSHTYPGAPDDTCDGVDNDCDGAVDQGLLCGVSIGLPLELQFGLSGAALMVVFLMVFSYGRRRVATP